MTPKRPGGAAVLAVALALAQATMLAPAQAPGARWVAAGEVHYHARDALTAWSGGAEIDELDVALDPDDLGTLRVTARVRPGSFGSGNFLRDRQARRELFEVDAFPTATLVARAHPDATGRGLPPQGTVDLVLEAELTLHGVTRPYPVTARLTRPASGEGEPATIHAEAAFTVSIEAHGMRRPSLFGLVTDDEVRVTVTVTARPGPAPTPTTP
jgi:polyisoprenoid-binding protein YceI